MGAGLRGAGRTARNYFNRIDTNVYAMGGGIRLKPTPPNNNWMPDLLANRRIRRPSNMPLSVDTIESYGEYVASQLVEGTKHMNKESQITLEGAMRRVFGDGKKGGSINIIEYDGSWYVGYSSGLDASIRNNVPSQLQPKPITIHPSWGQSRWGHHSDNAAINELINHRGRATGDVLMVGTREPCNAQCIPRGAPLTGKINQGRVILGLDSITVNYLRREGDTWRGTVTIP